MWSLVWTMLILGVLAFWFDTRTRRKSHEGLNATHELRRQAQSLASCADRLKHRHRPA